MKTSAIFWKKSAVFSVVMLLAVVMMLSAAPAALAADNESYVVDETSYASIDAAVEAALGGDKVLELNSYANIVMPTNSILVVRSNGYSFHTAIVGGDSSNNKLVELDNGDGTCTVATYDKDVAKDLKLAAMDVALSGEVQLRFFFKEVEYLEENPYAYLEVSMPSQDGTYRVVGTYRGGEFAEYEEQKNGKGTGRYMITVSVPYAQQADKVRLQVVDGEERGRLRQYSVKDYGDIVIENANNGNEAYKAFAAPVKHMLNTGAMMQKTVDYKTENLANKDIYGTDSNPVDGLAKEEVKNLAPKAVKVEGTAITPVTATAVLEGNTKLRMYFRYEGEGNLAATISRTFKGETKSEKVVAKSCEAGNAPTVIIDGEEVTATHYVQINNISAAMYDVVYKVTVTGENNSACTLERSVLDYIYNVLSGTGTDANTVNAQNTVRSMYLYYLSIKAFLDEEIEPEDVTPDPEVKPEECKHENKVEVITKKATCTEAGSKITKCADCAVEIGNAEEITALGHREYTEIVTKATCAAKGETVTMCSRCNAETGREPIETLSHTFVAQSAVAATCVKKGIIEHQICSLCGGFFDMTGASIENIYDESTGSHSYSEKLGLCVEGGAYKWVPYCLSCGQFDAESEKAKTALKVELEIAEDYVAQDGEIVVNVNVTSNPGFYGIVLSVVPTGDAGWTLSKSESEIGDVTAAVVNGKTQVIVESDANTPYTSTGTIATLYLKADGNTVGEFGFDVVINECIDSNDEEIDTGYVLTASDKVTLVKAECTHTNIKYNVRKNNHDKICKDCGMIFEEFASHTSLGEKYVDKYNIRTYSDTCVCGSVIYSYDLEFYVDDEGNVNAPNVIFTPADLKASSNLEKTRMGDIVVSNDGTYITFNTHATATEEGYFRIFEGSKTNSENPVTGQYLLIKYRTTRTGTWEFFGSANYGANSAVVQTNGEDDRNANFTIGPNSGGIGGQIRSGEWSTLILDLSKLLDKSANGKGNYFTKEEGDNYRLAYLRWDIFNQNNGNNTSVDVAYVAMADNLKALGYLDPYNGEMLLEGNYVNDETTGAATGNLLGTPYSGTTENIYFDPSFISARTDIADLKIDEKTGVPYAQFTANKTWTGGASEIRMNLWAYDKSPLTKNVGTYFAIVYRKPTRASSERFDFFLSSNLSNANAAVSTNHSFVPDGEWHMAVIDTSKIRDNTKASYFTPNTEIKSFYFDPFNVSATEGDTVDVAYVAMFDTMEEAYSYYNGYMEYYGIECDHAYISSDWYFVGDDDETTRAAIEAEDCLVCGNIAKTRDAVVSYSVENLKGNVNGVDDSVIVAGFRNNVSPYIGKVRSYTNVVHLNSDGSLACASGWAGINGLFAGNGMYRVLYSDGTVALDWTEVSFNRATTAAPNDIITQIKNEIPSVAAKSDPRRFRFELKGLNEYAEYESTGNPITIELAFVAEGAPGNDNLIPFVQYTNVYKGCASHTASWTPVLESDGNTDGVLYEEKICQTCGSEIEATRVVNYQNNIDGIKIDGVTVNPNANGQTQGCGGLPNGKYDYTFTKDNQKDKDGNALAISDKLSVFGWFACNGGVERYVYKINNGAWTTATGSSSAGAGGDAHITLINSLKLGLENFNNKLNFSGSIGVNANDLQQYATRTVTVTFGAVPANNPGLADTPNVIEMITINNVYVNCNHSGNTNEEWTRLANDPIREHAICSVCDGFTTPRYVTSTPDDLKLLNPEFFGKKNIDASRTKVQVLTDAATGISYAHYEVISEFSSETNLNILSSTEANLTNVGQVIAFLYRTSTSNVATEMFVRGASDTSTLSGTHNNKVSITADGTWNLAIITGNTSVWTAEDGLNTIRLDMFNTRGADNPHKEGDYFDIAYFAFFDSTADAMEYYADFARAYKGDEQNWCHHEEDFNWVQYEVGMLAQHCKYCNKVFDISECQHHDIDKLINPEAVENNTIFDYTADRCTVCGAENVSVDIVTREGLALYTPGELLAISAKDSSTRTNSQFQVLNEGGLPFIRYTDTAASETTLPINSGSVLNEVGKYFAIMYRTENNSSFQLYLNSKDVLTSHTGATYPSLSLDKNGEWNVVIFDFSTSHLMDTANGVGWMRLDIFNTGFAKGNTVDIAYAGFFSSKEAIGECYGAYLEMGAVNTHQHIQSSTGWKHAENADMGSYIPTCTVCQEDMEEVNSVNEFGLKQWMPDDIKALESYASNIRNRTITVMNDTAHNNMPFTRVQTTAETTGETYFYLNWTGNGIIRNTGKYIAILYRTNNSNNANDMFVSKDDGLAQSNNKNVGGTNATDWSLVIYDYSASTMWDSTTGVGAIRWDMFNTAVSKDTYMDIAYAGMFNSREEVNKYYAQFAAKYNLASKFKVNFDAANCGLDGVASKVITSNRQGNNAPVVIDCESITLTKATSLSFGGWMVTPGGVASYNYRVVSVDGTAVENPELIYYFNGGNTGTADTGITAQGYDLYYDSSCNLGAGFQNKFTLNLTGYESKKVNVEIVAVTNYGAKIVIAQINNIAVPAAAQATE